MNQRRCLGTPKWKLSMDTLYPLTTKCSLGLHCTSLILDIHVTVTLASDKSRYPLTNPAEELRFQAWLDLYINFVINAIHLSPFGQVDETTFEKVRISFSNESEILHVNTLICNKTKKITSMAKEAISGLGARPFILN